MYGKVKAMNRRLWNALALYIAVAFLLAITALCSSCVTVGSTEHWIPDPLFPDRYRVFDSNGSYVKEIRPDPLFEGRYISIQ
jgi:hypothetical protein